MGSDFRNGNCYAASTSCTLSAVSTGDLKLIFAYRNASTTAPTLPGSYTTIFNSAGGTTNSFRIYCSVASSSGDTGLEPPPTPVGFMQCAYTGTGATTTGNCAIAGVAIGISGAGSRSRPSTSTETINALSTTSSGLTTSWVAAFVGSTTTQCAPSGLTTVGTPAGNVTGMDSTGALASWASHTCSITSGTYRSYVVEILAASPAGGTPAMVQSRDCTEAYGSQANGKVVKTWTCRFPTGTQAGNMGLASFTVDSGSPTVSDDKSNSWFQAGTHTGANGETVYIFYAPNMVAGTNAVTISLSGGTPYGVPAIMELANVSISGGVDCTTGNHGNSTSVTFGSCTPTVSGDFVFGWFWNDYTVATTSLTAGSQGNITWGLCGQLPIAMGRERSAASIPQLLLSMPP